MTTISKEYELTEMGNYVRYVDDKDYCCISYNPSNAINMAGRSETAVIFGRGKQKFYIAHGDMRNEFNDCENAEQVKAKAVQLYRDDKIDIGFWSNDWSELSESYALDTEKQKE